MRFWVILLIALLLGGCMPENAAGTETTVPIQIGTDDSAEKKESGTIWERVSNASGDPSSEEPDKGLQVMPGREGQETHAKDEEPEKSEKQEETKKQEETDGGKTPAVTEKPASTETPAVTEKPVKEPDKAKTEQDSEKKEKEPEKKKEETVLTSAGEFLCGGSRYAYARLSEAEQIWYLDMEKILGNMAEKGQLSDEGLKKGLGTEHIDHIFQCIMIDHPELFYVEGYVYNSYTYGGKLTSLEFSGSYSLSKEEALARKKQIEEQARQIVAGCPKGTDDYGKIRYVYETLILRTDYRLDAPDNQNIYSVFVGRKSVCQGYAKATQYLLNLLGVECTLVSGTVGSGTRHGWNLVRADGNYYYLDTTWGDASYQPAEGSGVIAGLDINYDYLCVTTEELLRTHTIDSEVAMPACTAIADNYYVREGLFFYEADEERLRNLFAQADASKSYIVSLKCASKQCYDQIFGVLIGESRIFEFYGIGAGSVAYIQSEQQYSLTFWVTNAS